MKKRPRLQHQQQHQIALPRTTKLFGSGSGGYGELWHQNKSSANLVPLGIPIPTTRAGEPPHTYLSPDEQHNIKQISCGSLHVIILTYDGIVYTVGDNDGCQLGNGSNEKGMFPKRIKGDIEHKFIESVAAGGWFSAFVSRDGELFTCGELSREFDSGYDDNNVQWIPTRVVYPDLMKTIPKFKTIACGNRFLIAQDSRTYHTFMLGTAMVADSTKNFQQLEYIDPETLTTKPIDFPAKKIEGGEKYALILTATGRVFYSGSFLKPCTTFTVIEYFEKNRIQISDVAASWDRMIAMDHDGIVYLSNIHNTIVKMDTVFGRCSLIGPGNVHMYAMNISGDIFKIPEVWEKQGSLDECRCDILQFDDTVSEAELSILQPVCLTGGYFTTIIQMAQVDRSEITFKFNLQRQLHDDRLADLEIIRTF